MRIGLIRGFKNFLKIIKIKHLRKRILDLDLKINMFYFLELDDLFFKIDNFNFVYLSVKL